MRSVTELPWIKSASSLIGQREIAGIRHNPKIVQMWATIRAPFTDDETPWCAAFVGSQLEACGIRSTRSAGALSYAGYGQELREPRAGCIAVKRRFNAAGRLVGGHVTFAIGRTKLGGLVCLGGNQNDSVKLSVYNRSDFFTFRWPPSTVFHPDDFPLSLMQADGGLPREA